MFFFTITDCEIKNIMTLRVAISIQPHTLAPTRILSSFVPVDKAGDQHNECEESDGTHQADKPALS